MLRFILSLAALQFADVVSTWMVLHEGGREIMPIAAAIIERYGAVWLLALKAAALIPLGALIAVVWHHAKKTGHERVAAWGFLPLIAVAGFPVFWNLWRLA